MLSRRPSAPLAACGLILCALATLGLSRAPRHPSPPPPKPRPVRPGPTEAADPLTRGEPLDLNEASAADLELLPRIGPTLAARVVEDRAARGPFSTVGELTRVRGIGPRTLERLRPHLMVRETPDVTVRPP